MKRSTRSVGRSTSKQVALPTWSADKRARPTSGRAEVDQRRTGTVRPSTSTVAPATFLDPFAHQAETQSERHTDAFPSCAAHRMMDEDGWFTFRQGRRTDAPYLSKAFDRFQGEAVARDPLRRIRRLRGYGTQYARRVLLATRERDGLFLVAEKNEAPIGFIIAAAEPPPPHVRFESVPTQPCIIWELWVEPKYRVQGVGGRLLKEAERIFEKRGCDWVHLYVNASNFGARDFYRTLGYVERGLDLGRPLGSAARTHRPVALPRRPRRPPRHRSPS